MLQNPLLQWNVTEHQQEIVVVFEDESILKEKNNLMLEFLKTEIGLLKSNSPCSWKLNSTTPIQVKNGFIRAWNAYKESVSNFPEVARRDYQGSARETCTRVFYYQFKKIFNLWRSLNLKNNFSITLVVNSVLDLSNPAPEIHKHFFWVLDTDGLDCQPRNLNRAGYCLTRPISQLLELSSAIEPSYLLSKQLIEYFTLFSSEQKNSTHFVLWIEPNFEIYQYSTEDFDLKELSRKRWHLKVTGLFFNRNEYRFLSKGNHCLKWLQELKKTGGLSHLLSSRIPPEMYTELVSKTLDYSFDQRPKNWTPYGEQLSDTTLCLSLYFSKRKHEWSEEKGKMKHKKARIPFTKRTKPLTIEKVNHHISEMRFDLRKHDAESNKLFLVWAEPNRCNAPTMIRLNEETSQRFGLGYNGYKPCEKRVADGKLFCPIHDKNN